MRILLKADPFAVDGRAPTFSELVLAWPARWIQPPFAVTPPAQVAFRCRFSIEETTSTRLHVSADERYRLFLDGVPLGRGPDFGDPENWYFDTYELTLAPGEHMLVASVLMAGPNRAATQISLAHGLVVCLDPDSPLLLLIATAVAPWSCKLLTGCAIGAHTWTVQATGPMALDARQFPWGYESGRGDGWQDAIPLQDAQIASAIFDYSPTAHLLRPAIIPPQIDRGIADVSVLHVGALSDFDDDQQPFLPQAHLSAEVPGWTNGSLTIPANTIRRVLRGASRRFPRHSRLRVRIVMPGRRIRSCTSSPPSWASARRPWSSRVLKSRRSPARSGMYRADSFTRGGGSKPSSSIPPAPFPASSRSRKA